MGEAADKAKGLEIALDVSTSNPKGDVYELEVVGERGALLLSDFCRLKRTAPAVEWIVPNGSYGRVESVLTVVEAMRGSGVEGGKDGRGGGGEERRRGGIITARQGRNAQRVLDAVLASRGSWLEVAYD